MDSHLQIIRGVLIPLTAVILIFTPLFRFSHLPTAIKFILFTAVPVLLTFALAHVNRWAHLWEGHLGFPSGHMSFVTCAATLLVLLNPKWIYAAIPLLCAYGWLLVHTHSHTWLDVIGAALMAPPVTLACHAIFGRFLQSRNVGPNALSAGR